MRKTTILGFLFLFLISGAMAQKMNLNADIPVDRAVKIGKLENGLTYYIRKNEKPENRVEMRLAVDVGSMQEDEDQQGLAHFTEHMAFNGSKDFPKNELVSYLQSIGMRFGGDLNAYTSFDETVYMLTVPTDKPEYVETGLKVLQNWAAYLTLEGKEIDGERGIILEEWRMGLGADDRMRKEWFPVLFNESRYAKRLPIGLPEILRTFKHETIRRFYRDWYRPDLQAVVVVGDIDVNEIEKQIKTIFGEIPARENVREKILYEVAGNKEPLIAVATDKEATSNMIIFAVKHKATASVTIADFKEDIMAELFSSMFNSRLSEYKQDPNCPFIQASTGYGPFLARTMEAYMSFAVPKENNIEKSLEIMLIENNRVLQHGFLETEFDRAKEELLSDYERRANEVDKSESANFANEYVQHFLISKPIPGAKNEFNFVKRLLDDIELDEVNALAEKWITKENQVIIVTGPEKDGVKIPTVAEIKDILKTQENKKQDAYVDNFKPEPLIDHELKGGKLVNLEKKNHNITELTLSNGVKIVLKPTEFQNDEILMYAHSPGGYSLVPAFDFPSAMLATTVIDRAGIGEFDNVELSKKLKGKNISIVPFIGQIEQGFSGSSSVKDFETLLQLTYLYFEAPRKDEKAFESVVSDMVNQLKLISNNPMVAMIDTLYKLSTQNDPRVVAIPDEAFINRANLDKIWEIYNDRFSSANDFTFFFVGNFDVEEITPMLELYLGSLPNNNREETFQDVFNKFPSEKKDVLVRKGIDDKGMVGIIFSKEYVWDAKTNLHLQMFEEALSIKLIEVIREKMSGVYSPQTQMELSKYPSTNYTMMVLFGCSPKNANKLTKAVIKEITKIQKKGVDEVTLNKVKEQIIREREKNMDKNRFWLNRMSDSYFKGDDLNIDNFEDRIKAVSSDDIKKVASELIDVKHYVRTVLNPEKKK